MLGEYNNLSDTSIIEAHAKNIASTGIDFAAISWGKDCAYDHVMELMDKHGVKTCCLYESLIRAGPKRVNVDGLRKILRDMDVIKGYFDDPCWLRINGKPVVMLYVTRIFDNPAQAMMEIRDRLGDVFLVGDELFWGKVPAEKLRLFDAVTAYNMYETKRFAANNPCDSFQAASSAAWARHSADCASAGIPLWANAMPGYDDTQYRPQSKHPIIPRMDGEFFRKQLEEAKKLAKDVVMITSFNEWYEGTQIEPSTMYGDKYMRMIREIIK